MTKLAELQAALTSKRVELEQMQGTLASMKNDTLAHFEEEISEEWDNSLRECYSEALDSIPFYLGDVVELIKDNDPTSYRCGLNDFADGFDVTGLDAYTDLEGEIEDLESEIESLEDEIEYEIEELEQAEEDEE